MVKFPKLSQKKFRLIIIFPVAASSNASSPVIEARSLAPNNDQRNPNGGGERHRNLALRGVGSGGGGGGYGGARGEGEEEEGAASASPSSPPNSLFSEHRHHQQTSPSSEVRKVPHCYCNRIFGRAKGKSQHTSSDGAKRRAPYALRTFLWLFHSTLIATKTANGDAG